MPEAANEHAPPKGASREPLALEESIRGTLIRGTLIERLGIEFLEVGPDRMVARMPVEGNTQPFGLLHGGATASLCETVASVGTAIAAGPEKLAVGIELNVNHLRSVRTGFVTCVAEPLTVGRSIAVWDMRVRDDAGRLVAVSRLTLAVRDSSPPA
jgi:1,4-dihydroxy-2-naphthoyl-CoA hydrolase